MTSTIWLEGSMPSWNPDIRIGLNTFFKGAWWICAGIRIRR